MRIGRREFVKHQLTVALDDGEQIVEVVRDAAGQAAYGFHLLGLAQLLFQSPTFGNILGDHLEAQRLTAFVLEGIATQANGYLSSIFTLPPQFATFETSRFVVGMDYGRTLLRIGIDVAREIYGQKLLG